MPPGGSPGREPMPMTTFGISAARWTTSTVTSAFSSSSTDASDFFLSADRFGEVFDRRVAAGQFRGPAQGVRFHVHADAVTDPAEGRVAFVAPDCTAHATTSHSISGIGQE